MTVVHMVLATAGHMVVGLHRVEGLVEGLDCSLARMAPADRMANSKEDERNMGPAEAVDHMVVRMAAVIGCRMGYSEVGAEDILGSIVAAYSSDIVNVAAVIQGTAVALPAHSVDHLGKVDRDVSA